MGRGKKGNSQSPPSHLNDFALFFPTNLRSEEPVIYSCYYWEAYAIFNNARKHNFCRTVSQNRLMVKVVIGMRTWRVSQIVMKP